MRLTKENKKIILELNEGFTRSTYYSGKNSSEGRTYTIRDGKLHISATGKTSWSDSRYSDQWIASDEETHRFLYKYKDALKLEDKEKDE